MAETSEALETSIVVSRIVRPWHAALFVAIAAFVVYLTTMSHSVDFIDSGELATVCSTLGIAHPTGYPLFTLIGWLFTKLPIASSIIVRLNIMAAFFTAVGAGAMVLLEYEIIAHWLPPKMEHEASVVAAKSRKPDRARKSVEPRIIPTDLDLALGCAIVTGLVAAFSSTWWAQSTGIEVYPLHLSLIPVVLWLFLQMLRFEEGESVGKNGNLFALILGLSFANHMTTVLIAPATIYLFFARYGFAKSTWLRITKLGLPFIAGLAVYLYLPIRSSENPLMDWGHPTTLSSFLKHITGGQYKIWMFSSTGAAAKNWSYFWSGLPSEFVWIGLLFMLIGLMALWKRKSVGHVASYLRRTNMLLFTLLLFFGCLLYSINYDIHDIDSYFLLAYLTSALWIGAGSYLLPSRTTLRNKPVVALIAALLIAGIEIGVHYKDMDESGNYMVEDYTKNLLRNLPPHAIIFSTQWDFWLSGAFYYQSVEHIRPDVLVIDKAMLRDRPWYYARLKLLAPDVMSKAEPEMGRFLGYLRAFDRGDPYDEAAIAPAYQAFTEALVQRNLDRPIFITQEMVDEHDELFAPNMKVVPGGIMYRLVSNDTVLTTVVPKLEWHDAHYRKRDYYTDDSRILQAEPLASNGLALLRHGDSTLAKQFFDAALTFKPDMNADLSKLTEREQELAQSVDQKFQEIASLDRSLRKQ